MFSVVESLKLIVFMIHVIILYSLFYPNILSIFHPFILIASTQVSAGWRVLIKVVSFS